MYSLAIRYIITGFICLIIGYCLNVFLFESLDFLYYQSVLGSVLLSTFFHFILSRWFTFKSNAPLSREILKYSIAALLNYLCQCGLIMLFMGSFISNYRLVAAISIFLSSFIGFFLLKNFVFVKGKIV